MGRERVEVSETLSGGRRRDDRVEIDRLTGGGAGADGAGEEDDEREGKPRILLTTPIESAKAEQQKALCEMTHFRTASSALGAMANCPCSCAMQRESVGMSISFCTSLPCRESLTHLAAFVRIVIDISRSVSAIAQKRSWSALSISFFIC